MTHIRSAALMAILVLAAGAAPASAQRALGGIGALGGLAQVAPSDVADAALTCAKAVGGERVDLKSLEALGWRKVAPGGEMTGRTSENATFFQRSGGRVQIFVGTTGEAAATCAMMAGIGDKAQRAEIERLISAQLGVREVDAANPLGTKGMSGWRTGTARILLEVMVARGGLSMAHILVVPRAMASK